MNPVIKKDIDFILDNLIGVDKIKNKTFLITGANGMLPAYLVETLLSINNLYNDANIKVIAWVRNLKKAESKFIDLKSNHFFSILEKDVCETHDFDCKIDYIIHAASQASPKYYNIDPVGTLSANILGTINLLNIARKQNVDSFLFFSSGEVYGEVDEKQVPIKEDTFGYLNPINVRSCYAESKRMGENICISWYHQYGVKVKIVRPFHTYGPGMALDDGRVFADFVSNILQKRDIVLKSDGSARRAFCYVADATLGFLTTLLHGENGNVYNIGNPYQELSVLELAKILVDIKPELKLEVVFSENSNKDYLKSSIKINSPNVDKIKSIGWTPTITAKEGFTRTINSFE